MNYKRLLGAGIAGLAVLLGASIAFTQVVPNFPARIYQNTVTHYVRKTISYNEAYSTGNRSIKFARLPSNAHVLRYSVNVTTAFNAATTNRIWIGAINATNGLNANAPVSAANYVLAADTDACGNAGATQCGWLAGTAGRPTTIATAVNFGNRLTSGGDVDLWANYTQTGTAATAGAAIFVIEYAADNDL